MTGQILNYVRLPSENIQSRKALLIMPVILNFSGLYTKFIRNSVRLVAIASNPK